ncbi:MAG: TIGR03862 family flavoprotein [Acidimicrobiales bacterium]
MLARAGVGVTVFERMPTVGRKLQVAGRGGLNLTHSEPLADLLDRYGPARARVAPAIGGFDPTALRAWSEGLGEVTFVGSSGRVFPFGLRSTALLRAWLRRLADLEVDVRTRHTWVGWDGDGALAFLNDAGSPIVVRADACVLALGGASWPRTGSDGAWVPHLTGVGVGVTPLRPTNCGFVVGWSDVFRERFAGAPLKDVALAHRAATSRGDAVITEHGIEGGPIYALASGLRDTIDADGEAELRIDLLPAVDLSTVVARLDRRRAKDSMATGLGRAGLAPVVVGLLREVTGNRLPTEAVDLAQLLRALPLRLAAPMQIGRAISTAGGVSLDGVDDGFMLRDRPGTFVAGEMLDWEAPTGGYLLQACFSTGVAAAEGALGWLGTLQV